MALLVGVYFRKAHFTTIRYSARGILNHWYYLVADKIRLLIYGGTEYILTGFSMCVWHLFTQCIGILIQYTWCPQMFEFEKLQVFEILTQLFSGHLDGCQHP